MSDFDEAYSQKVPQYFKTPPANYVPFIGSYPQVAKPGETGDFFVNTYLLQPNRKLETVGAVPVTHLKVRRACM